MLNIRGVLADLAFGLSKSLANDYGSRKRVRQFQLP